MSASGWGRPGLLHKVSTWSSDEHKGNTVVFRKTEIGFALRDPIREYPPAFIQAQEENTDSKSWFFDPTRASYSYFGFAETWEGVDEIEYLTRLSRHLPDWICFYAAPNRLRFNATKKIEVPVVFNQGEQLYFVKAKKSRLKSMSLLGLFCLNKKALNFQGLIFTQLKGGLCRIDNCRIKIDNLG